MTEQPDHEQREDEPDPAQDEGRDDGVNDPLTRSDVEAPRAPFGSGPPSDE